MEENNKLEMMKKTMCIYFTDDFKNEYEYLMKVRNRSRFICRAIRHYIEDELNLNELEKLNKLKIYKIK